MHDDLIGEFENYPTAKEMWDNIYSRYGQTSETRLRALHLKWMTYTIDSSRSITEHVRSLQAMLRDLKAAGVDISEREQWMNVLRALLTEDDRWKPFINVMTHNENIKNFAEITKHLELEDELLKACAPPPVALVARVDRAKGNKFKRGKKKSLHPSKKFGPRGGIAKKQVKAKGKVEKNMARVMRYNCRKKGHYAWDCPEPSQTRKPAST